MTLIDVTFILMIAVILVGASLTRKKEKKNWNNGYCSECGSKWVHFDSDSQGGRGYHCPKCDRYIWISYNVDK